MSLTQDNFIIPVPPVGGLPISQYRLDRMNIVRDCTISIISPVIFTLGLMKRWTLLPSPLLYLPRLTARKQKLPQLWVGQTPLSTPPLPPPHCTPVANAYGLCNLMVRQMLVECNHLASTRTDIFGKRNYV